MPKVKETDKFRDVKFKLDKSYLIRVEKLIDKIVKDPGVGKPMQYERKGTRELYLPPFRVSYAYNIDEDVLIFLDIYHKKKQ